MLRSILHCDMNNFYASVECMLDPALKKYPIAVCGSVECFFSLTAKNALRKEGFPVTSILPEMTDPSTRCRIKISTDTSTWED